MLKLAKVAAHQQETEWSCSAATLKAAALHFGVDLTEATVIKAVGARKGRGAETDEIVAGAQKLGFESWEKSFKDLDDAKAMLRRGIPIIADFQSFNHPGKGHYVLIAGFKPDKGFIIMDPNTKGKTAVDNWRILSAKEMEEKWWDRAMAPPHKLMPKWGVMIMPKQKEKVAWSGAQAINRAKAEAASSQHAFGKESEGDETKEIPMTSPRWGAIAGGGAGMALGSISGAQTGVVAQKLKERAKAKKSPRLAKLIPQKLRNLGSLPRRMDAAMKGGTYGAAVGIPLGAALGYKLMQDPSKEKKANGDMLQYFQDHPQKLKEKQERDKKKLEKKANDPIQEKRKVQGINIHIEWPVGSERTYYNHDPLKPKSKGELDYKTKMKASYGYVPKVWDADGEDLDVYLGPNEESTKVFVIEQIRPSDDSFDENKIMIGYDSSEEAKKSYLAHMPKKYFGSIRATTVEAFKKEFLMGKARFSKKADARALGLLGGGLLGHQATKATRKSMDDAGIAKNKQPNSVFNTAMGAWSGADLGGHIENYRINKARGAGAAAKKYIRNPAIAGALGVGGLAAGIAHIKNQKAAKDGKSAPGGPLWAAGSLGALHGGAFGGSIGGAIGATRRPGPTGPGKGRDASGQAHSARYAAPSSHSTPDWAKGAKTQKEVKQRFRDQARAHHSDRTGGTDDVMKRVNTAWSDFQKTDKFKGMAKEAAMNAFADELRRIMEGNAHR